MSSILQTPTWVISRLRARGIRYAFRFVWAKVSYGLLVTLSVVYHRYVITRARLTGRPVIRVVGDSHVKTFRFAYPFTVQHLGGATAYNVISVESSTNSRYRVAALSNRMNRGKDWLLLVFGEIDCRIHIYDQYAKAGKSRNISDHVGDTVDRYIEFAKELSDSGVPVSVYSVPPAAQQENVYGYTHYGSPEERSSITREFNRQLSSACGEAGISFIDIYPEVATDDGFTKSRFAADEVHLNRKAIPIVRSRFRALGESSDSGGSIA